MTNSTIVSWVPEPDGRGTVGLLWSCIVTIFLCTWSAVHPNLPGHNEPAIQVFWSRVGYVLVVMLVPELMVMIAVAEMSNARRLRPHTPRWTLRQCFFLGMGGFVLQHHTSEEDQPSFVCVKPETFVSLVNANVVDWPSTTDAEIDDRSKADWVMKTVTLTQVSWFVAQVIGRAVQRLPVTALELYTLSIVLGAAFMYIAWWNKPYDIRMPIILQTDLPLPKATETMDLVSLVVSEGSGTSAAKSFLFVLFAVGAMQLAGWNFFFPTLLETWLWRASGLGMVVAATALIAWWKWEDSTKTSWVEVVLATLLVLFRLFTCVEVFVGLRAVPAGVYKTPQWSQYLPSIG